MNTISENGLMELAAINEALKMLKNTYENLIIKENNSKYEEITSDEGIYKYIDVNIRGIINNIPFETMNCDFSDVNMTDSIEIYNRFKEIYIEPLLLGFNTYEDFSISELPENEQSKIKQFRDTEIEIFNGYGVI